MACVLAKTRLEILVLPDRPLHESYAFGFGTREQQHTVPDHAVAEKRRGAVEENQVEPIAPDLPAQHSDQTPDRVLDCRGIRRAIIVEKHRYVDIAFPARSAARPAPVQPGEPHRAVALQCARKTAAEASFWHEDDGTVVLHGRFPSVMGARIQSALDAARAAHAEEQPASEWDNEGVAPEDVPRGTSGQDISPEDTSSADAATDTGAPETVTAQRREYARVFLTDIPRGTLILRGPSRTVRRADALAWMAERLFEPGDAPALAPDRHEIVVHVEAEVLADGRAGRCEIEHRTAIAAETARRLCCDAGIVPVVDGPNGEPLSVGRRNRSIPPAVRRALANRDRGCRFPGCTATHRLQGHHVKHWAEGGETSLDNLVLLCPTHHRLVHEGGFDVQRLDDGAFRFTNPHGLTVRPPKRAEMSSPDTIVIQNDSLGLAIDCETATAHWHGERIDYDHALMVAMASWDSGDTRPEAGPAAGDWNPS